MVLDAVIWLAVLAWSLRMMARFQNIYQSMGPAHAPFTAFSRFYFLGHGGHLINAVLAIMMLFVMFKLQPGKNVPVWICVIMVVVLLLLVPAFVGSSVLFLFEPMLNAQG